ncbi:MAG: hypothetical protein BWY17_04595 [Deltaproteobacteria bacterium ADurb.Bin207]|nr:MAG: hypothetical protein BWY17_04595 [Deltaproteobacteria bacterium ADurb.Bin207]
MLVFVGNADTKAVHTLMAIRLQRRCRRLHRCGIALIPASHDIQESDGVLHASRQRTNLLHTGSHPYESESRHTPVGWFDSYRMGEGCGLSNAPSRIASQGKRNHTSRHRCRTAPRRPPRHKFFADGIARRKKSASSRRTTHRQLIHIRFSENNRIGLTQASHGRGFMRTSPCQRPMHQGTRCARGRSIDRANRILDGHRYSCQRAKGLTSFSFFIDDGRLPLDGCVVEMHESANARVPRARVVHKGFGNIDSGQTAFSNLFHKTVNWGIQNVLHSLHGANLRVDGRIGQA